MNRVGGRMKHLLAPLSHALHTYLDDGVDQCLTAVHVADVVDFEDGIYLMPIFVGAGVGGWVGGWVDEFCEDGWG